MCAASDGHAEVVKLLLAHGADTSAKNKVTRAGSLTHASPQGASFPKTRSGDLPDVLYTHATCLLAF